MSRKAKQFFPVTKSDSLEPLSEEKVREMIASGSINERHTLICGEVVDFGTDTVVRLGVKRTRKSKAKKADVAPKPRTARVKVNGKEETITE